MTMKKADKETSRRMKAEAKRARKNNSGVRMHEKRRHQAKESARIPNTR